MTFVDIQANIQQIVAFGGRILNVSFGYMRVSTASQNLDRQFEVLKKYVSDEKYIFTDRASGKDMERDGFQNMLKAMRPGDVLYIKSIDRLGRNKIQIKEYLQYFKQHNIRVKIIDIPTTMQDFPSEQAWIADMVNNIILEVYASIADQERQTLLQRQKEGIQAARKKGKHLGRPRLELPDLWEEHYKKWERKELKTVDFMRSVNMKKPTFYKKVKEYRERSL